MSLKKQGYPKRTVQLPGEENESLKIAKRIAILIGLTAGVVAVEISAPIEQRLHNGPLIVLITTLVVTRLSERPSTGRSESSSDLARKLHRNTWRDSAFIGGVVLALVARWLLATLIN